MGDQVEEEFLRCCPPEFTRKYQLVRPLGKGTTSLVYLARQIEFDRDVVVKIFHHEEPELFERFMREGELLARLDHPGIMKLLDFGGHGEFLYLVARYVPGTNLKDLAAIERFEWQRLAGVFRVITDALAAVHAKGIIHRDLKPANILITEDGLPVILDFGFARATDTKDLTRTGFYIGTPSYGAPEALLENHYDARTDLYAVGVMMYELLAGKNPFYDTNLRSVVSHHLELAFSDLPPLPPGVPVSLVDLLSRLLAKDPARRPASAKEVNLVLKRLSAKRPAGAAASPVGAATVAPAAAKPAAPASTISPLLVAFVMSGLLSACLLAYEMDGLIPEVEIQSLDPPLASVTSAGPGISDTEREALLSVLRDVSLRAQERMGIRQTVFAAPFDSGPVEPSAREHLLKGQQDQEILRRLDEDLRARIPVESLTRDDRRVVAWVRTLRFITVVDIKDFSAVLNRPLLAAGATTGVTSSGAAARLLGMEELKLFAEALDSMVVVLDPAAFADSTPPWILSYLSMGYTVALTASGALWDTSLISLRDSRMDVFEKKLDSWSWDRGPGSALARLAWLAWRRGRGHVSAQDQTVQRRMAAESIAELRRHPACDALTLTSLELFLFPL